MDSASTHTPTGETSARIFRTFWGQLEDQDTPALCLRIRSARERLQEQWKATHPGERGNPYTQEKVANRMGITTGAYGAFERYREPDMQRQREIAAALGLDEDYFSPSADLASATARVEAEADRLRRLGDSLEELLTHLRAQTPAAPPAQAQSEPD